MSTPPTDRTVQRSIAPKLAELSENVLFGDVWERTELSKRDRSLITIASLIAMYRTDQLRGHLNRALDNGVTSEEIGEVITHTWPFTPDGRLPPMRSKLPRKCLIREVKTFSNYINYFFKTRHMEEIHAGNDWWKVFSRHI